MSAPTVKPSIWHRTRYLRKLLALYLLICLAMMFIERPLVYPAPRADVGDWTAAQIEHQDVQFQSSDGTALHGWLFEHPSPQYYIVYFHGNGEHVAFNAERMDELRHELAATVFIFDYRGYGKSEGVPFEAGVIADGRAAIDWLAEHTSIPATSIVLMGRSIGGGVAVALAAERPPQSLVLQNTFAKITDSAAKLFPWLPVRLLMQNRYDSLARIAKYQGPVLQSHGSVDTTVALADARRLFDAIPSTEKQFLVWPGGGHNDDEPETYYATLRIFLADAKTKAAAQPASP